jgi:hypothetical protein
MVIVIVSALKDAIMNAAPASSLLRLCYGIGQAAAAASMARPGGGGHSWWGLTMTPTGGIVIECPGSAADQVPLPRRAMRIIIVIAIDINIIVTHRCGEISVGIKPSRLERRHRFMYIDCVFGFRKEEKLDRIGNNPTYVPCGMQRSSAPPPCSPRK